MSKDELTKEVLELKLKSEKMVRELEASKIEDETLDFIAQNTLYRDNE